MKNIKPRLIELSQWRAHLANSVQADDVYIGQSGPAKSERDPEIINRFLNEKTFGSPAFYPSWRSAEWKLNSITEKEVCLEALSRIIARESALEAKSGPILAIAEEILLNGLISAPAVAREEKILSTEPGFRLYAEWNEDQIWIHGQDPFGAFFRQNFARSFMDGTVKSKHGHSGRGLEIILESASDLFIRSVPQWGTWVAARVDLRLSNREHDLEPKRVILDFK